MMHSAKLFSIAILAFVSMLLSTSLLAQDQIELEKKYVKNMPRGSKITILNDLLIPMGQNYAYIGYAPKTEEERIEKSWVRMGVTPQNEVRRIMKDRPFVIREIKVDVREENGKKSYYVHLYFEGDYGDDHFTIHSIEQQPLIDLLRKGFEITLGHYKEY